jgi:DNA polymerase-1
MSSHFRSIVVCDLEYETFGGGLPDPLCMVAYVLSSTLEHMRTIRVWRGEFGSAPPFDIGEDTLFVGYSAWAEMQCFMALGWPFPKHIFDQHTAFLAASNRLLPHDPDNEKRKKEGKRLPDACHAYGIEGWERVDKDSIAADIGNGNWQRYGKDVVFDYCEEDVRKSAELLRAQLRRGCNSLPAADVPRVLHWSNYSAKAIARIQAVGMPVDMRMWNLVQENKAAVVTALLEQFDPSHDDGDPVFNAEGEFSYWRFEQWLIRSGVAVWPRLETGKLDLDSEAFRLMAYIPGVSGIHVLRDSLRVITGAKLVIGPDGRNQPKLFPFGTATGRNAHRGSLFNAHAGMRSFLRWPEDKIAVYLDWRTQEVGIAASQSGDEALIRDYSAGDIYHALARMTGRTSEPDPVRWKKQDPETRQKMKPLQLGINYGMGVPSLARGLERHPLVASAIIELHKRTYPRFWAWRENAATCAMLAREIRSEFGWPLRITTSPNRRTLYNFPMQSAAAARCCASPRCGCARPGSCRRC